jgi:dihydroorotate dehydrogenase electron transfer subunit
MGQFFMLRAWKTYPVLSRPISVFDKSPGQIAFLYKVVGVGTAKLSRLRPGDDITLDGPHGNGFPDAAGRVALVGGGVGVAPFFLAAKTLRQMDGVTALDIYLGFSGEALLEDAFAPLADRLTLDVGGFITDTIDPAAYDMIFACGPEAMMRALHRKCRAQNAIHRLWVSLENRMACGLGACLVCTCRTATGNRKACTDGPVFRADDLWLLPEGGAAR